jgi:hypothetical protein
LSAAAKSDDVIWHGREEQATAIPAQRLFERRFF